MFSFNTLCCCRSGQLGSNRDKRQHVEHMKIIEVVFSLYRLLRGHATIIVLLPLVSYTHLVCFILFSINCSEAKWSRDLLSLLSQRSMVLHFYWWKHFVCVIVIFNWILVSNNFFFFIEIKTLALDSIEWDFVRISASVWTRKWNTKREKAHRKVQQDK